MAHPPKWLAAGLLALFSLYSFPIMFMIGYDGIWRDALSLPGSRQVLADLVVMALLACLWMREDARRHGRRLALWVLLTLTCGSLGPLLYLLAAPKARPVA